MKLRFDSDLPHQRKAVDAVVEVFTGQSFEPNVHSNSLNITQEELIDNIKTVQMLNGIDVRAKKEDINLADLNFTIEMETGTGKTYVYLRSIFELNYNYGYNKFIIVVPSAAIKEGVMKTLRITEEHFRDMYPNAFYYEYFMYDSRRLNRLNHFVDSTTIQIMVITIDAFRKDFGVEETQTQGKNGKKRKAVANVMNRKNEITGGYKPIEIIQRTRPIVIIDEPQSVEGKSETSKGFGALRKLNALFTLRYSATHIREYIMLYKLDSIDAYNYKLVKKIDVGSIEIDEGFSSPYIKIKSVCNAKNISAIIDIDAKCRNGSVSRTQLTIVKDSDLFKLSGDREVYRGYVVEDISCKKGKQYVKFHSIPDAIKVGEIFGSASKDDYQRWQIRQTIREHLNRELIILHEGLKIKVLSLFFLDSVSNYRVYDDDGKPMSGKLVRVFEEEYNNEIKRSKYALLNDYVPASDLHNGYFAKDKKTGKFKDSRGSDDNTDEGYSAYELIMREKEKLLSFDTKLKFIFTHSALREGWDNPNVFQICTLNERSADAKIAKKQEIGRGLRLPVDQNGTRILDNQKVNVLTVIANESYEEFVANLQRDIENDRGRKFGAINRRAFVGIKLDETSYTDEKANDAIITYLKEKEYLDGDDKFTLHKSTGKTKFEVDADNGSFELSDLPDECSINRKAVFDSILQEAKNSRTDVYEVGDKRNQRVIKPKEEVLMSETFSWLWDKIKYKTKYEISVDTDDLVKACIPEVRKIIVGKTEARYKKRGVSFDKEDGIQSKEAYNREEADTRLDTDIKIDSATHYKMQDIIIEIADLTSLTHKTVARIIGESGISYKIHYNPHRFVEEVAEKINDQMKLHLTKGIKYERLGEDEYYTQKLFERGEVCEIPEPVKAGDKSLYSEIPTKYRTEMSFAECLENDGDVKLYFKLPSWFKIPTPLGTYNPDWAVLVETKKESKLYFVVETKSTSDDSKLRKIEVGKIDCGIAHFIALGDVTFAQISSCGDFNKKVSEQLEDVEVNNQSLNNLKYDKH